MVRDVLKELVREISAGEEELDAVEPGLIDGFIGGGCVPLDVGLDLFNCQRTRGRVGRGHRDGRWADQFETGVLCLEQFGFRDTAMSPKLEESVRAVGMDCVYNLQDREVRQRVAGGAKNPHILPGLDLSAEHR